MANTYHQVYIQSIFAVKYRQAIITPDLKPIILSTIGNLVNETGCKLIIVNCVEDHVHCFIGLKPSISISDVMKTIKAKSSKHVNENNLLPQRFEWQEGFGVFSYSHSQIDKVYRYIANQEAHHRKQNFRDEYKEFLNKFKVPFDEQYIFEDLI